MKWTKAEKDEARAWLVEHLHAGDTVYSVLRHVARSGMSREVSPYIIRDDHPLWIGGYAARVLGLRIGSHDGLVVGGCGFDAGFEISYNIGRVIYPEGFECIGERCPSNDHSNGDRDYTPHRHGDGGYALLHRWM